MKDNSRSFRSLLCFVILTFVAGGGIKAFGQQAQSPHEKELIKAFNKRIEAYLSQRNSIKKSLPSLPKEATPEQIQSYQRSFADALRVARVAAKPGDVFAAPIAEHIRALIKAEVKGPERAELRQTVLEADTKGVPVRVNYPYPDAKEFTQIPPPLLLKLPQLPKELKYRFVNLHMLLVDSDNDLIVDYMLKAVP